MCRAPVTAAACILYVPANLLPIMETKSLFGIRADTIMSGIVYLWHSGSWDLATINAGPGALAFGAVVV